MNFKQKLRDSFEYLISSIFLWLSLPLVLGSALILFIIRGRDEAVKVIECWEDNVLVWKELLSLYKETGYRYSKYEVRHFIFEDKRDADVKEKDTFITPGVSLFENDTIIYFEPSDYPKVKRVIKRNLSKYKAYASTKDLSFFFWPTVGNSSKEPAAEIDFFKTPSWVAELLNDWLERIQLDGPCLIYNTNNRDKKSGNPVYEVFYLPKKGKKAIKIAVFSFIYKTPDRDPGVFYQLCSKSKSDE